MNNATSSGLEGMTVAETLLSHVDGEKGELLIRGYPIETFATKFGFEEAAFTLLFGETSNSFSAFCSDLKEARKITLQLFNSWKSILPISDAMTALQAGLSLLDFKKYHEKGISDSIAVIGAMPVLLASWNKKEKPPAILERQSEVFLTGEKAKLLGAYWATVIDHGMNASTFTARVVASTGSDLPSSVVAAIGALKGPLHGRAPGPVLDMLDTLRLEKNIPNWIQTEIENGRRIMGIGHRIYKVRDPRAAALEAALTRYETTTHSKSERLVFARKVEKEMALEKYW